MSWAVYPAMVCTVAMLLTNGYFLLGGLPLLLLRHDEPLDARFVSAFFTVYYRCAFWAAAGACLSYLLWGRLLFALGAGGLALAVAALRQRLVPLLQRLGTALAGGDSAALAAFRRVHGLVLGLNLGQLVLLVSGLLLLARSG